MEIVFFGSFTINNKTKKIAQIKDNFAGTCVPRPQLLETLPKGPLLFNLRHWIHLQKMWVAGLPYTLWTSLTDPLYPGLFYKHLCH